MAQEATKVVEFDGAQYTVSTTPYEDLDVLEAHEDGKYSLLAKALLGPVQYAQFRKDHKKTEQLILLIAALLGDDEEDTEE